MSIETYNIFSLADDQYLIIESIDGEFHVLDQDGREFSPLEMAEIARSLLVHALHRQGISPTIIDPDEQK